MVNNLKEYMLELGYNIYQIDKILNSSVLINLNTNTILKNVKDTFSFLEENGYGKDSIIKMTFLYPSLYGRYVGSLKNRIQNIIELGYSKKDVIKMTIVYPNIFGYSSMYIKVSENASINGYELSAEGIYKIDFQMLDRSSNDGEEYFMQKALIQYVPDAQAELKEILQKFIEGDFWND